MPIEPHDSDPWPWVMDPSLQAYRCQRLLDSHSAYVLAKAISELAHIRCPILGMADSLADLHASVSLLHQGQAFLPATVTDARNQNRSWTEIAAQLGITPAAARHRYSPTAPH